MKQKDMKQNNKNPLAYLGWLGIIGILGIGMAAPWMLTFLLFFFFFTYSNAIADELFWAQVRRAGLKAFTVNIVFNTLFFLFMFIRTSFVYKFSYNNDMQIQSNGNYQITEDFMGHIMLGSIFQVLSFIITLSTFIFSLMYYRRQEKKFMGEETC